jgi:hypothetical protein
MSNDYEKDRNLCSYSIAFVYYEKKLKLQLILQKECPSQIVTGFFGNERVSLIIEQVYQVRILKWG